MMIGLSDGKPSQLQRIHELLLTHYPLQVDEWDFKISAAHEQALKEGQHPAHHEKWKLYLKGAKTKMKGTLRVSSASLPHLLPALEGIFTLKREKVGKVVYKRKFRVFLSLIGNFYTMFGQDEVSIEDDNQPGLDNQSVTFQPVLYPAPYGIYRPWFSLIKETLTEAYPGYEFVPYHTLRYRPKDVSTGYSGAEGTPQSLFQALFSPEDINPYLTVTDHKMMSFEEGEFD
jgi:hypothetical protein